MTSVHEQLKQGTLALHQETERAFEGFDLATMDGYRDFLTAQAAAFLPLEAAAERGGVAELFDDWASRRRSDALRSDLARLKVNEVPSLPVPDGLDPLGIAYVLEGSRHGGRMLAQMVLGAFPEGAEAVHFLQHAAGSGWWRRFVDVLEAHGHGPRAAEVLASAQQAFGVFMSAARRLSPDPALSPQQVSAPDHA